MPFDFYRTTITALMKHCYAKKSNSGKTTLNVRNLRNLCKESLKSLKNLNPVFLKEIFDLKELNCPVHEKYKLILQIPKINQVRFGTKSLRTPCHTTLKHPKVDINFKFLPFSIYCLSCVVLIYYLFIFEYIVH